MYIGKTAVSPPLRIPHPPEKAANSYLPQHYQCRSSWKVGLPVSGHPAYPLPTVEFQVSQEKGTVARSEVQWELGCLVIPREQAVTHYEGALLQLFSGS